ncbi:MAG: amidase [Pseudomonadota bacterium]
MSGTLAEGFGKLRDLSAALSSGEITPAALVEQALERIAAVDPDVQAFLSVNAGAARATAEARGKELSSGNTRGPLHGIPFAVKDVIDVAGLPTRAGSRARAGAAPEPIDATMVARLKAGGAIFLGKVHTTEFAFFTGVPPTRNPHDLTRTPGGSSGGSAAAVASGAVPLSLGTQTAGSVNRPAAFCGVGAFKPTGLSVVGRGIVPFAPSFDTVGTFAATAADAAFGLSAFAPEGLGLGASLPPAIATLVMLDDPKIDELVSAPMASAVNTAFEQAAALGLSTQRRASPIAFADLLANHRTVMFFEIGRIHGALLDRRDLIEPVLADGLEEGRTISESAYLNAVQQLSRQRLDFWAALPPHSAIMLPAAPGVAPAGMPTGDPTFVTVATALGGPTATVRAGTCEATAMPLGALIATPAGSDAQLAATLLTAAEGPLAR